MYTYKGFWGYDTQPVGEDNRDSGRRRICGVTTQGHGLTPSTVHYDYGELILKSTMHGVSRINYSWVLMDVTEWKMCGSKRKGSFWFFTGLLFHPNKIDWLYVHWPKIPPWWVSVHFIVIEIVVMRYSSISLIQVRPCLNARWYCLTLLGMYSLRRKSNPATSEGSILWSYRNIMFPWKLVYGAEFQFYECM